MKTSESPTIPAELAPILARSPLAAETLSFIPAAEVPAPFHQLLVHDHDMTSELGGFHQDSIALTVHHCQRSPGSYLREVTLHAATCGKPVEYGLIEICLDAFPPALRPLILAGDVPLGAILNHSGLSYRSEPQGFFTIPAAPLQAFFPNSPTGAVLYGRYNHLVCDKGTCLARILEILPTA